MTFRLDHVVLTTISLASVILGIAVYSRAPDRVWNRLFAVQAFAVSIWVLLNYLLQAATTTEEAALWLRLTHPSVALVICTCVDLFWVFPERTEFAPWPRRLALYFLGFLFSLVAFMPNLFTSLELARGTVLVEYGWPFLAFGVFAIGTLGYADYILIRKRPRLTGLQRAQVNYVLTGMIIGQLLALLTMVLLPLIWHNTFYARWGSASYMLVIGFMAYSVAKHGIIRPAVAIIRATAYLVTASLMLVAVIALARVGKPLVYHLPSATLFYMLAGVVLGFGGAWIHQWIKRRLENELPGAHLADAAQRASGDILRTLNAEELPDFVSDTIIQMLRAAHVSCYTRDASSGHFRLRASKVNSRGAGAGQLPAEIADDSLLVQMVSRSPDLLDRSQIRRFHSFEEAQRIVEAMRHYEAEVVAPILWEDRLMGLVVVGEALAGDMYGPEEMRLLQNMLPQVSLAVRNSELFDEVVRIMEYNENILRQMQSGVIAVNSDRRIVTFNPAAEEILGLSAESVLGRTPDVLPTPIAARLIQALSGIPLRPEDRIELPNAHGQRIPVACSTSRWRGAVGSQDGAITVISDLTLVEELEQERRDAEHLNLIRVLSAGMAHEIRNPLVAIRTFAELLPSRWDDDEFRGDFLSTAQEEIERIDRLLTDLLMLSKPAGAVVEAIDVNRVCEGVTRAMSANAEAKQVSLVTDLRLDSSRPFFGDRGRLHQALVNLVKNALEAEPPDGLVKVTTEEAQNYDSESVVLVTVHNDNSYIPEGQLQEVFRPFYSRRHGGTGLGLSVCQTIIEEHHGSIRAESSMQAGTDFIVELPVNSIPGENSYGRNAGD
ncbi:MAG: ATP-binding protein [Armatimonadia bacterium]